MKTRSRIQKFLLATAIGLAAVPGGTAQGHTSNHVVLGTGEDTEQSFRLTVSATFQPAVYPLLEWAPVGTGLAESGFGLGDLFVVRCLVVETNSAPGNHSVYLHGEGSSGAHYHAFWTTSLTTTVDFDVSLSPTARRHCGAPFPLDGDYRGRGVFVTTG